MYVYSSTSAALTTPKLYSVHVGVFILESSLSPRNPGISQILLSVHTQIIGMVGVGNGKDYEHTVKINKIEKSC